MSMIKYAFAKVFEIGDYQVLLTKEYNPDDDLFVITQQTELNNCTPKLTINHKDEVSCNGFFNDYALNDAISFLNSARENFEQ